ncbi:MAG TPA: alpha/beta fold hydrolase [Candidatus Paceibacterota bacterium]
MNKKYDPKKIEKKWQKYWQSKKTFVAGDKGPKEMVLIEFPYPSGAGLHMGHMRPFIAGDVVSKYWKLHGKNVMYPIGWDAFGLPAENYAIKNKVHPSVSTAQNIKNAKKQLIEWGTGFDWSREINTTDPNYYKWTQKIFLEFYKAGLAYEATGLINWCPQDKTGLANEEVVDGKCERCGTTVEKKSLRQWYLKITDYAEKLLEGLKDLPEWPEPVKIQQANWIGKSEGAELAFELVSLSDGELKKKTKFLLLHGKNGNSQSHFLPWLKAKLEKSGYEVCVPNLPNAKEPNDDEQTDFARKLNFADKNTIIVGHSFGGIVALRLLERGIKAKKVVLVGTPFSGKFIDGKVRPSVLAACKKGFDFEKINKSAEKFICIYDKNDDIISTVDGKAFTKSLNGEFVETIANEPHFRSNEDSKILSVLTSSEALQLTSSVKVFTTRADTLFGVTYLVLAPEHPFVGQITNNKSQITNKEEIKKYVGSAKKKTDIERGAENKEKTGVELKGVMAVNPANGEKIPIWVADYVLASYGTGAVMAVPAHDERDFEFAKKYKLPIKNVIDPVYKRADVVGKTEFKKKNKIVGIVEDGKGNVLVMNWGSALGGRLFLGGTIEEGETADVTARRELLEEAGYTDAEVIEIGEETFNYRYFAFAKGVAFDAATRFVHLKLKSDTRKEQALEKQEKFKLEWLSYKEVEKQVSEVLHKYAFDKFILKKNYPGTGIVARTGKFDGLTSEEAHKKITEFVDGKIVIKYKLRDWVFSRQRYWGEPIPLIHCDKCGIVPVPEKDLPVKLPNVKKYEPTGTGEGPLAAVEKWVNTQCPKCKGKAKRETDTMPQWAGSSWYWMRYMDPKNKKEFADIGKQKYWSPVDLYFGGMEHTTLHLLYSRFWNLFLYDRGLAAVKEPYRKRVPHGIILAPDGNKMSKSKGNFVNPDDFVKLYGADTVRLYMLFLGPHEAQVAWNDKGIVGTRRFLERVWNMQEFISETEPREVTTALHKMMKKVSEDLESFSFNTAVSTMMIFANTVYEAKSMSKKSYKAFLKILSPFVPHLAEELWASFGNKKTIYREVWPEWDRGLIKEKIVNIAVQVNGKVRGELTLSTDSDDETVKSAALADQKVANFIGAKKILKTIIVKNRLINLVILE